LSERANYVLPRDDHIKLFSCGLVGLKLLIVLNENRILIELLIETI